MKLVSVIGESEQMSLEEIKWRDEIVILVLRHTEKEEFEESVHIR